MGSIERHEVSAKILAIYTEFRDEKAIPRFALTKVYISESLQVENRPKQIWRVALMAVGIDNADNSDLVEALDIGFP